MAVWPFGRFFDIGKLNYWMIGRGFAKRELAGAVLRLRFTMAGQAGVP